MTAAPLVPGPVTARVPAKVNLELLVGARRADGYHALSTVFHAVSLYDDVTVSVADAWGVSVSGPLSEGVPEDEDNLAMRAARLVQGRFDVEPVHVSIRKGIPVSGGMAGGSGRRRRRARRVDRLGGLALAATSSRSSPPSSATTSPSSSWGAPRWVPAGASCSPRSWPAGASTGFSR